MSMSELLELGQPSLPGMCAVTEAVGRLASMEQSGEHGAVYTRAEVVEFMLDLAGYTSERPLHAMKLLEPSFGGGDFLLAAVRRLLVSCDRHGFGGPIDQCIRAVELHARTYADTRSKVLALLSASGIDDDRARKLVDAWLINGDFLLTRLPGHFDFVVGNPPYVRQELIPPALLAVYRQKYATLYDRGDLYVPFFERSLDLIGSHGRLVFICANRWMKNRYGGPLRELIAGSYHLRAYVDMEGTDAFHSEVSAYPAITLVERTRSGPTLAAARPEIEIQYLTRLAKALLGNAPDEALGVTAAASPSPNGAPWVFGSSVKLELLRRVEAAFPALEDVGCKVGIGVATGSDKAFIAPFDELDVESSRKLPLATTRDIATGTVQWTGLGVVNPFEDDGTLVDLAEYPRLCSYLEQRRESLVGRHVARRIPASWYRTIDRIHPALALRPKLLIPDINGSAQVVFESGRLYPHHNLYYVVSDEWDLRALQAVLLSGLTRAFIAAYSTAMRGGFLRFQAQYLRRIRLPRWDQVPNELRLQLARAADSLDIPACDLAVASLYGLTAAEAALLTT
jgi:hypothetical protein